MSGYLYKDFINCIYDNPLIILIYSLLFSFFTLFINRKQVKPILYTIILLIIIVLGYCLFTNNLLYFLLSIEIYNLLYILLLYNTSDNSSFLAEAKKLSLLSMVISCIMVFGTTLVLLSNHNLYFNSIDIYNPLTKLGLSFVLIGILFKLCVFPFHIWILDIYKKSPYYIVLISDCFLKLLLLRILLNFIAKISIDSFNNIFLIFGTISMFLGIILSIKENNIKRFLGLFNISHIGLLLLILSINTIDAYVSCFGYLLMYSICSLVFLFSTKDNIEYFREFKTNNISNKTLNTSIISLLAMICIPPFHTFLSKIDLILIVLNNNKYTVLILSTVYFILEIIVIIYKLRFLINNTKIQSSYQN